MPPHFWWFTNFKEAHTLYSENLKEAQAQWENEGIVKGEAKALLRFLTKRFGAVNPDLQEKVETASLVQIEAWIDDFLQVKSPEELLARTL